MFIHERAQPWAVPRVRALAQLPVENDLVGGLAGPSVELLKGQLLVDGDAGGRKRRLGQPAQRSLGGLVRLAVLVQDI